MNNSRIIQELTEINSSINNIGGGGPNTNINLQEVGGISTSINSGTLDNGTQRITIGTNDLIHTTIGTGNTSLGNIDTNLELVINENDAVFGVGDSGIMALAVRADNITPRGINGDYVPFQVDNNGQLYSTNDVRRIGGIDVDNNAGVLSGGCQRITIATDDSVNTKLTAIQTSVQLLDNAVNGDFLNVGIDALDQTGNFNIDIAEQSLANVQVQSNSLNLATQATLAIISTNTTELNKTLYNRDDYTNLKTTKNHYIINEHYSNLSSNIATNTSTFENYLGLNIDGSVPSTVVTSIKTIYYKSKFLVFETTHSYDALSVNPGQQTVLLIRSNPSSGSDMLHSFCIDSASNDLTVNIKQDRIGTGSDQNLTASASFNLDILDGNGLSGIDITILNIKHTFRIILSSFGDTYFQIYSPNKKQFVTFHYSHLTSLAQKEVSFVGNEINIIYRNQANLTSFFVDSFSVYLTDYIDIDIDPSSLLNLNIKTPSLGTALMVLSRPITVATDDLINTTLSSINTTLSSINTINLNSSLSSDLALRLGLITGITAKIAYGYNANMLNQERGICHGLLGSEQLAFVSLASSFAIASTDVDAQIIEIEYYADTTSETPTTQLVTLNGLTKVTITNNMFRIIKLANTSATNPTGTIYIGLNSDGFTLGKPDTDIFSVMVGESNQSRMSLVYVPPNKEAYVVSLTFQSDMDNTADIYLVRFKIFLNSQPNSLFVTFFPFNIGLSVIERFFPDKIGPSSTLFVTNQRVDGNGAHDTIVQISYILVDL